MCVVTNLVPLSPGRPSPTQASSTLQITDLMVIWILLPGSSHVMPLGHTQSPGVRVLMGQATTLSTQAVVVRSMIKVRILHNIIIILTIYITGGRTLVLHLVRGDTLDLYCEDCSATIYRVTFCVSLSTFDIE